MMSRKPISTSTPVTHASSGTRSVRTSHNAAGASVASEAPAKQSAGAAAIRIIRALWPWLAALGSGLLLTFCFPRWNQGWLCWIALTPLLCALWFSDDARRRIWWKKAALGYCAGLTFFWTSFSWLTTVTVLGWFLLAFYLGLYFAAWGLLVGTFLNENLRSDETRFLSSSRNLRIAFFTAAAWVGLEWIRGVLFSGFGWNAIGVALHENLALIQIADLTGVGGISFLVVFCNATIVLTLRRFRSEVGRVRIKPHYDFTLAMALVAIVFGYGVRAFQQPLNGRAVRVAAIQANIPQGEKFDPASERKIFETYTWLTEVALAQDPQLVIWPESATPRPLFGDEINFRFVTDLAARGDFDFLLGTTDFDASGDYNVAALLTERGENFQIYRKVHLVPFGEFIPFRHSFPLFAVIAGDLVPGDFTAGREFSVLKTDTSGIKIAPLICFEDTIGDLTRRFVLNGAQLLVNVTNDGWFKRSQAAEQHLVNALFRTIETRRAMVRAANTGVTAVIDPFGRITQELRGEDGSHFMEGVLFSQVAVPEGATLTFYAKYGEVFSLAALVGAALFVVIRLARRTRS